ncbi:MAG: hypothetical protein K9W44_14220 [Candidatus Lokiarchaeota archaeon]|nr:hypothetical protein [Candidatus Harpocratesius repetitus]
MLKFQPLSFFIYCGDANSKSETGKISNFKNIFFLKIQDLYNIIEWIPSGISYQGIPGALAFLQIACAYFDEVISLPINRSVLIEILKFGWYHSLKGKFSQDDWNLFFNLLDQVSDEELFSIATNMRLFFPDQT